MKWSYIIIPKTTVNLDIAFETGIRPIQVKVNTLISGENCQLHNNNDKLDLLINLKTSQKIIVSDQLKNGLIQLLSQLNIEELRNARLSLDDAQNMLERISSHWRLKTWKETSLEWMQCLGNITIELERVYSLVKCRILEYNIKCIQKNICLFYVKQ